MHPAIRLALLWTILGISALMTLFTVLDVGSGASELALWIGLIAWPGVGAIAGWIIRGSHYDPAQDKES